MLLTDDAHRRCYEAGESVSTEVEHDSQLAQGGGYVRTLLQLYCSTAGLVVVVVVVVVHAFFHVVFVVIPGYGIIAATSSESREMNSTRYAALESFRERFLFC